MEHPVSSTNVEWHRLIDGDPHHTGWYIVAHRGFAKLVIFNKVLYPTKNTPKTGPNSPGWRDDVSWATHWARMPLAPNDGTPQLFTPEGKAAKQDVLNEKAYQGIEQALQEYDSRGMPSIMWEK